MKLLKPIVVLGITGGVLGALLAVVAYFTMPVIAENRTRAETVEQHELMSIATARVAELNLASSEPEDCRSDIVISTTTIRGYGGEMRVMAAFIGDNLIAIRVPTHKETPGFSDVLSNDDWLGTLGKQPLVTVDTVSRATITTTAVLEASKSLSDERAEALLACSDS